jgi:8-oxo-dGTP pyrophosphatase MutT (NUDIX family)
MRQQNLSLTLQTLPPVMKRDRHVLILVQDSSGRFILGGKKLYPPGIYRMVGGGIEVGEEPLVAATREFAEELGPQLPPTDFKPLLTVIAQLKVASTGEELTFTTCLYHVQLAEGQQLQPSSDLDDVMPFTKEELEALIQRYAELPTTTDPQLGFAWADYGRLYGPVHQLALDSL